MAQHNVDDDAFLWRQYSSLFTHLRAETVTWTPQAKHLPARVFKVLIKTETGISFVW